MIKPTNLL